MEERNICVMKINGANIVFFFLIAIIGYQQYQMYIIKKDLRKELIKQVDSLDVQLDIFAKKDLSIIDKLEKAKENDSIIDKQINKQLKILKWKIRKNEKINDSIIDAFKRDRIRAILKAN